MRPLPSEAGLLPMASVRMLVVVMVAVVVSFLVATTVAQVRDREIDDLVGDIVGNAMPSVQQLARARTDLHHLVDDLATAARAPTLDAEHMRRQARQTEAAIHASLDTYRLLPTFPGEAGLGDEALKGIHDVETDANLVCVAASTGDHAQVEQRLGVLREQVAVADEMLLRIVDFDAAQGERLGRRIEGIRMDSLTRALALDALSVGLAVLATVLAVRTFRRGLRAAEAATASERERATELEAFAGRVAHDLRDPLNAVALRLDAATRRPLTDEQVQRTFERLQQNAARMNRIIDGLLAFARGGARPDPDTRGDVAAAIDDVMATLAPEAATAGIELRVEGCPRPAWVRASDGALASILGNLARNALKYVRDGQTAQPWVVLRAMRLDGRVRVEVEDNGPGIPAGKERAIFDPYVRAHDGALPGLGLGLATVKRLVEAHAGEVGVRSQPGAGALFWFELPSAPTP